MLSLLSLGKNFSPYQKFIYALRAAASEVGDNIIPNMNIKKFLTYEVDNYTSLPN